MERQGGYVKRNNNWRNDRKESKSFRSQQLSQPIIEKWNKVDRKVSKRPEVYLLYEHNATK